MEKEYAVIFEHVSKIYRLKRKDVAKDDKDRDKRVLRIEGCKI